MSAQTVHAIQPLSEDEYDRLDELLEAVSPLDVDGLHGLLHAVAVAPSVVPISVWLAAVTPAGLAQLDAEDVKEFASLLVRLHVDVLDAINQKQGYFPEPDDVAGCEAFAAGYVAGAELDPEWINDEARWTFASPLAYLGGRLDLVPKETLESIDENLAPDPKEYMRRNLGGLIAATHDCFKKLRAPSTTPERSARGEARPGRNDPCPCGSGKKYKRCCIEAQRPSPEA